MESRTREAPAGTAGDRAPLRPLVLVSSLCSGGAERVVVSLVCRLAERGLSALLCTLTSHHDDPQLAEDLQRAEVPRIDLGAARLCDPRAALRYLQLLQHARIDVVHAHGQDAWVLASLARPLTRIPLVLTRHVLDEPAGTWRLALRRRCALAAARRANALVAPSSATAERLAQLSRVCSSDIRVIPNGIELERFDRPVCPAVRQQVRRALGFKPDEYVVMMPAVLRHGKGHDVLLEAFPKIRRRMPQVKVVCAGGGEREAELRQRASRLGPELQFLGHRRDLPDLLMASDLVVLPSLSEALPTALIEAAAAGKPVVATPVGGTADVVVHGVTGLLVPPGDPSKLAEAVVAILSDPVAAESFGRAGREIARRRFSLDGYVDRTLELWRQVAASRRMSA